MTTLHLSLSYSHYIVFLCLNDILYETHKKKICFGNKRQTHVKVITIQFLM